MLKVSGELRSGRVRTGDRVEWQDCIRPRAPEDTPWKEIGRCSLLEPPRVPRS